MATLGDKDDKVILFDTNVLLSATDPLRPLELIDLAAI